MKQNGQCNACWQLDRLTQTCDKYKTKLKTIGGGFVKCEECLEADKCVKK